MPIELKQDARITTSGCKSWLIAAICHWISRILIFADTHTLFVVRLYNRRSRYLFQLQLVDSIFGADTQFNEEKYIQLNPNL